MLALALPDRTRRGVRAQVRSRASRAPATASRPSTPASDRSSRACRPTSTRVELAPGLEIVQLAVSRGRPARPRGDARGTEDSSVRNDIA